MTWGLHIPGLDDLGLAYPRPGWPAHEGATDGQQNDLIIGLDGQQMQGPALASHVGLRSLYSLAK